MAEWRLIRSGPLPGGLNMGLDEALLESVAAGDSPGVLRLYGWNPPTLTLGYSQSQEKRISLESCRRLGISVVRRPTGGRAVLHDQEVTYAVLARENEPPFASGILANYRVIGLALQRALQDLGLPVDFAPARQRSKGPPSPNCFTAPSNYELVMEGCKVSGSAQRRLGGAFLQHGSIPVEMDLDRMEQIFSGRAGALKESLMRKVGWLNRWLAVPVTAEQVEEAIATAFSTQLGVGFSLSTPSDSEWERARRLRAEKYADLV